MPRSRNTEGAICMSMAMAGFSASDALSKSVIAYMNAGEIMFLRGLFTSILVYLIAWKLGALRPWRVMLKPVIALRIACEIIAAVTYITALGMMPIANASAILQSQPKWLYEMLWPDFIDDPRNKSTLPGLYGAGNVLTLDELPGWK